MYEWHKKSRNHEGYCIFSSTALSHSISRKVQTIFARGIANTKMRDFYDVYGIVKMNAEKIDKDVLISAFHATCKKRETVFIKDEMTDTLSKIKENEAMAQMWEQFTFPLK